MNRKTTLLVFLPLILISLPCFAQLKLTEQKVQTYSGYVNPRVVDGKVLSDAGSKPVLTSESSIITVVKEVEFKYFFIDAEKLPTWETVDLEQIEGGYKVPEAAGPGTYRITAQGFEPGMARKRIDVVINAPVPIVPIDDGTLGPVAKESRAAIVAMVNGLGANFDQLAADAESKTVKTVIEASAKANSYEISTRDAFKAAMAKIMQPQLGKEALPEHAPKVFKDMAAGFKSVR